MALEDIGYFGDSDTNIISEEAAPASLVADSFTLAKKGQVDKDAATTLKDQLTQQAGAYKVQHKATFSKEQDKIISDLANQLSQFGVKDLSDITQGTRMVIEDVYDPNYYGDGSPDVIGQKLVEVPTVLNKRTGEEIPMNKLNNAAGSGFTWYNMQFVNGTPVFYASTEETGWNAFKQKELPKILSMAKFIPGAAPFVIAAEAALALDEGKEIGDVLKDTAVKVVLHEAAAYATNSPSMFESSYYDAASNLVSDVGTNKTASVIGGDAEAQIGGFYGNTNNAVYDPASNTTAFFKDGELQSILDNSTNEFIGNDPFGFDASDALDVTTIDGLDAGFDDTAGGADAGRSVTGINTETADAGFDDTAGGADAGKTVTTENKDTGFDDTAGGADAGKGTTKTTTTTTTTTDKPSALETGWRKLTDGNVAGLTFAEVEALLKAGVGASMLVGAVVGPEGVDIPTTTVDTAAINTLRSGFNVDLGGGNRPPITFSSTLQTEQDRINEYARLRGLGYTDAEIRAAAEAKFGKQTDVDWNALSGSFTGNIQQQGQANQQVPAIYSQLGINTGRPATDPTAPTTGIGSLPVPTYKPPPLLGAQAPGASRITSPVVTIDQTMSQEDFDSAVADIAAQQAALPPVVQQPPASPFESGLAKGTTVAKRAGGIVALRGGGMPLAFMGGGMTAPVNQPRMLAGGGDGMSDSIPATIDGTQPARLADGEFVIPADVVSDIGNGSSRAGAKQLYAMMDRVRQSRHGTTKQPPEVNMNKVLPV